MKSAPQLQPIISIGKDGYRRKTIQCRHTIYPVNLRVDKASHESLESIKDYYERLTGLRVRRGVITRRAIAVLADHLVTADPATEQAAIVKASRMEEV